MEIKSQQRKYFHLYWSNLKIRSPSKRSKKRSLREPVFSFSIQSCSSPCWIFNNQFPYPNRVVSSFSSLVMSFMCTGWGTYPGTCFGSVFQEQAPSCVLALTQPHEGGWGWGQRRGSILLK